MSAATMQGRRQNPWQLQLFSKTLKKQQKLRLLLAQIGATAGKDCLLVTNGDNNGALNYYFRAHGGNWTWVENEEESVPQMEELLGEPVLIGSANQLPLQDESFDVVVSIDVHEHLEKPLPFNRELKRVVRPGGTVVVTTPNGDRWKPLTVLKQVIGMAKSVYGHRVIGYNVKQHSQMLLDVGIVPKSSGSYSRFFTELVELGINFAYVKILSKKRGSAVSEGTIAPSNREQLRSVEKQFRIYSFAYPALWLFTRLDYLLFFATGYAVVVRGERLA